MHRVWPVVLSCVVLIPAWASLTLGVEFRRPGRDPAGSGTRDRSEAGSRPGLRAGPAASGEKPAAGGEGMKRLCQLGTQRYQHATRLAALAVTPDGRTVACAGKGQTIDLLAVGGPSAEGLKLLGQTSVAGDVLRLAFAPDGRRLVSLDAQGNTRLWNVTPSANKLESAWHAAWPDGEAGRFRKGAATVRFTADGRDVLLCDSRQTAWVLGGTDGRAVRKVHDPFGRLAALSADSETLFIAAANNRLRRWSIASGETLSDVELASPGVRFSASDAGRAAPMCCLLVHPDGRTAVLGTKHTLTAVEWATGRVLGTVARREPSQNAEPPRLAFSPDGKELAVAWTAQAGPIVQLHAWPDGHVRRTFPLACSPPGPTAFSADGRRLFAADGRTVREWDMTNGKEVFPLEGHADAIAAVVFSPDGSRVATIGMDRRAGVWRTDSGRLDSMWPLGGAWPSAGSIAFSPDGARFALTSGHAVTLHQCDGGRWIGQFLLDPTDAAQLPTPPLPSPLAAVGFSPDGKTVAAWAPSSDVVVRWDAASGKQLDVRALKRSESEDAPALNARADVGVEPPVEGFFSNDLRFLAGVDRLAEELTVWETATGRRMWSLRTPRWMTAGCFSPDGKTLAVGRDAGLTQIWAPGSGRLVRSFEGPDGESVPRAFLEQGQVLVSEHADGSTRFWNVATGRPIKRLDGRRIAACSRDERLAAVIADHDVVAIFSMAGILPQASRDRQEP